MKGRVKVLYLIDSLVPGGAERSLVAMAAPLAGQGVTLEVGYLQERPGLQRELVDAGVSVTSLAGGGGRIGWAREAAALVRRRQPDLIHTTLYEADLIGRMVGAATRVPVVTSLVNVRYGPEQRAAPGVRAWKVATVHLADAVTARRTVRFHAITEWIAEVMGRRLRIPDQRIDVVPRGRDPLLLGRRSPGRSARARLRTGVAPDVPMLVAAARQEHQKGLDLLLEAMPLVLRDRPDATLLIAGRPGNQTPLLEESVRRLGLAGAVSFLGVRDDVPDLLAAADVFVVPSRWEGLGSVLLEAMALESPIVASGLPPIREVVPDDRHAWLVPPDRPGHLAEAILAALGNPDEARKRASQARRRFLERFTIDRVTSEMAGFYQRALDAGRSESRWLHRRARVHAHDDLHRP